MKRDEILATASRLVTGERRDAHGEAEDSFRQVAGLWGAYFDFRYIFGPQDVAAMMVLFKIGRQMQNHEHADNYVDMAGYVALWGEMALRKEQAK